VNLADMLKRRAAASPEHPAILFEGSTITYRELDERSSQLAHAMAERGIAAGDRIAIFLPNLPEFAIVYYAAQRLGAVPVSINAIFRSAEVEYLINDSGARAVFTTGELEGFVPRDKCPALEHLVAVDSPAGGGATPGGSNAEPAQALAEWVSKKFRCQALRTDHAGLETVYGTAG
jgi:long-chain acyl-CoA synthetase